MEESKFCTECGYDLQPMKAELNSRLDSKRGNNTSAEKSQERVLIGDSYTTKSSMETWEIRNNAPRYITPISNVSKRKGSHKKMVAVVILFMVILASAAFINVFERNTSNDDNDSDTYVSYSTDVTVQWIDTEVTSSDGAFESGTLSYTTGTHDFDGTTKSCFVITLSNEISSQYGYYVWTLFDENGTSYTVSNNYIVKYTGSTVCKDEASLYWTGSAGEFTVTVTCYQSEESYNMNEYSSSATYSGELILNGNIEYTWSYKGTSYDMVVPFSLSEFEEYHNSTIARNSNNGTTVTEFVVYDDEMIESMAEQLQSLYQDTYGSDASISGQSFANFVLAFVQYCYEYPTYTDSFSGDMFMYGISDYYAYPVETVYYGMGDCEDTSILAASIYEACGYQTAIGLISYGSSGHAVVGVALDSDQYVTPTYNSGSFGILSQTIDGITYYGGETTSDTYYAVGVITKEYISSVGSYYGDILCGFYPV